MSNKKLRTLETIIIPQISRKLTSHHITNEIVEDECLILIKNHDITDIEIEALVVGVYETTFKAKNPRERFDIKSLGRKKYIYFYQQ